LRDTFLRIVARAGEWPADALLVAGDLFEHDRVSRDTIATVRRAFESVPHVPIFIAPGNHDPYLPDSPYATQRWPDNVFIFTKPAWSAYALERIALTVHGFGFDGPDISTNPFGLLRIPEDGRVHVAVAHGSEMGSLPAGKGAYAPFDAETSTPTNLRYLALGHFHGAKQIAVKNGAWVQYSGSPEGHGFGETGMHVHMEIEIDGQEVRVREVPASQTVFSVHAFDCSGMESSQQIIDGIRALPGDGAGNRVVRVMLRGAVSPELRMEIASIHDSVREHFEHIELVDELDMEDDLDALALEQTSLGAFAREIAAQLRDATDDTRRKMLMRAREVGIAAYRGRMAPVPCADGE
jgi:DNA repair exonuclease SbcCD nuclease subunit